MVRARSCKIAEVIEELEADHAALAEELTTLHSLYPSTSARRARSAIEARLDELEPILSELEHDLDCLEEELKIPHPEG